MSPCVCVARSMKVPSGSVQCDGSVVAAWASLSLTTHKYQPPGTPRHIDTGAATIHSIHLLPFLPMISQLLVLCFAHFLPLSGLNITQKYLGCLSAVSEWRRP